MSLNRVAITGMGFVTPLGVGVENVWKALKKGQNGAKVIEKFDVSEFSINFGAEVKDFEPTEWLERREVQRSDPFVQYGLVATDIAINNSNIDFTKEDLERVGVIIGSGIGGLEELENQNRRLINKGPRKLSPFYVPKIMMNAISGKVGIKYGFKGPNFATTSACASGKHAIATAFKMIQFGVADIMITGGTEAALTPSGLAGFTAMKALSSRNEAPEKASRPFDKDRDGFVLGEGAGVLVLENMSKAKKRNAEIYSEILGVGMTCDAYHITAPDPDGKGAAKAMELALKEAGCKPEDVSYINAHGTSTEYNDIIETKAIKRVFGDHAKKIAVSSSKSMIGHLLGASGGVELGITALSIRDKIAHPTRNHEIPDPQCDLDYVPGEARELDINVAISNSLGFGGHNASIVIGKVK